MEALAAEVDALKGGVSRLANEERRAGSQAAAALGAALPHLAVQPAAPSTDEENEARLDEIKAEQVVRDRVYHDRLDDMARAPAGPATPVARQTINRNLAALEQLPPDRRPTARLTAVTCSAEVCRVEFRLAQDRDPRRLEALYRTVLRGMSEMVVRPVEGDRLVLYMPASRTQLPAQDS